MTLYTIGHSTRTAEELLDLLRRNDVHQLVDVRAFPGSRRHPHFGREALHDFLTGSGIAYIHSPELGGRRKPRPEAPPTAWREPGFAAYADYMTTAEFKHAIDQLLGARGRATNGDHVLRGRTLALPSIHDQRRRRRTRLGSLPHSWNNRVTAHADVIRGGRGV